MMCYVFIYLETLYWYDGISVSGVLILASPDSPLLVYQYRYLFCIDGSCNYLCVLYIVMCFHY
jgi:hypothetical protein